MPSDNIQDIYNSIRNIARQEIARSIPDVVFGTVTSTDPLNIQLGETGIVITESFLSPSPFIGEKKLTLTVDDDTQSGRLWRAVSTGDRVVMIKAADNQKFVVLWRADGSFDYNDELSWSLSSTTSVVGSTTVQGSNIVQMARSQIGVREVGSSNQVKYNTWYYGSAVRGTAYPWCAVFVSWCANACGINTSIVPRSAAVLTFENFFRQRGRLYNYGSYTPVPGDFYSTPANGHIGIVESVTSSTSWTGIEGNYNNQVARVTRNGGLRYVMHPIYPS